MLSLLRYRACVEATDLLKLMILDSAFRFSLSCFLDLFLFMNINIIETHSKTATTDNSVPNIIAHL
ncbi:hypothetical protein HanRHA438_Chr06g0262561 [Helianthus annuus]|nr:hypothetical protein HanRHA438_Chr06g0262561 [Helianthus annuus]